MKGKQMLLFAAMLAAVAVSVGATDAAAADPAKPELALTLTAQKEVTVKDAEGKATVELREVKEAKTGDIVKYTIAYKNVGAVEALEGRVVDPIPKETTYVSGSAEGKDAAITFSLDGKAFQDPTLLKYKVRRADGTEAEYTATPDMYSHIQWKLQKPVPPGGTGSVSFKVMVR